MVYSRLCIYLVFQILFLFVGCSSSEAQIVAGKDIIFVKSNDGKRLLARITRVTGGDLDVVSLDGKKHRTFKLSQLTKIEKVGERKIKGYIYPVNIVKLFQGGPIGTWGITRNATFQIVYSDGKKWSTSTGGASLIALASQKYVPTPKPKKDKAVGKKMEKEVPRRFRRGVTGKSNTNISEEISAGKRKRGVYWSRTSNLGADVGTSISTAGKICYNSVVEAKMTSKDYDTFRFNFPGGKFVCYSLSKLDLVADILDQEGKSIARSNDHENTKNFRFERNLKPGIYYVQIRVMRHAGAGPYYLVLGNGRKFFKENSI